MLSSSADCLKCLWQVKWLRQITRKLASASYVVCSTSISTVSTWKPDCKLQQSQQSWCDTRIFFLPWKVDYKSKRWHKKVGLKGMWDVSLCSFCEDLFANMWIFIFLIGHTIQSSLSMDSVLVDLPICQFQTHGIGLTCTILMCLEQSSGCIQRLFWGQKIVTC